MQRPQLIEIFLIELRLAAARRADGIVDLRLAQQGAERRQRAIALRVEVVAAFERYGDTPATQFMRQRDQLARQRAVTGNRHRHRAERIEPVRVKSGADQDQFRLESPGEGNEQFVPEAGLTRIANAGRQWHVDVRPFRRARANLAPMPGARVNAPLVRGEI
jgi:hypothetical protein